MSVHRRTGRNKLGDLLTQYFSLEDLRNLAFDLDVDFDELPGWRKSAKARGLIAYLARRDRLHELVELIEARRPNLGGLIAGVAERPEGQGRRPCAGWDLLSDGAKAAYIAVGGALLVAVMWLCGTVSQPVVGEWAKSLFLKPTFTAGGQVTPESTPVSPAPPTMTATPTSTPTPPDEATPTPTPTMPPTSTPIRPDPKRRAIWVWDVGVVMDDGARASFFEFVRSKRVSAVYLHAYNLVRVNPGALERFITEANGVEVELLAGDPSWALADNHDAVVNFTRRAVRVARDADLASRPVGLHLDIEPHAHDEWQSDPTDIVVQYLDLLVTVKEELDKQGCLLHLGVDIPFWYDTVDILYNGETRPLNQHVQDIVDYVVVLDYRDTAAGSDGMILHARDELLYADRSDSLVAIGVETNCTQADKVTFCEEGEAVMEQMLSEAALDFGRNEAFHGFSIHDYRGYVALSLTVSPQPSVTPSATPVPSPAFTETPQPSVRPTATPLPPPPLAATPLSPPTVTATPQPSATPTATPSPPPTFTETPQPSVTPTATPCPSVTPVPPTSTPTPYLCSRVSEGSRSPHIVFHRVGYRLNDGPLQTAYDEEGITVHPDDTISIVDIWYCSGTADGSRVQGEAYLRKHGVFDEGDGRFAMGGQVQVGEHLMGDFSGSWTLQPGWDRLVIVLVHYYGGGFETDDRFYINLVVQ